MDDEFIIFIGSIIYTIIWIPICVLFAIYMQKKKNSFKYVDGKVLKAECKQYSGPRGKKNYNCNIEAEYTINNITKLYKTITYNRNYKPNNIIQLKYWSDKPEQISDKLTPSYQLWWLPFSFTIGFEIVALFVIIGYLYNRFTK